MEAIVQAVQAGGNLGILFIGLALMRTNARVTRLELIEKYRKEGL